MKLLFVFTGGTIGSTVSGDVISVDESKPYIILKKYAERYFVDFTYDTLEPFYELSENFSGEHISRLIRTVVAENGKYDGIIVTHGTDTLQYSAAALGYALGNDCNPVCLVSANFTLEDSRSNGIDNLHAAVNLIRLGSERGVFVPYRNNEGEDVQIHRATRLSASLTFSDDLFSVGELPLGTMTEDGCLLKNPDYREIPDQIAPPAVTHVGELAPILRVYPYPGMSYPPISGDVRAVILETYHSGTVNTKSAKTRAFLEEAKARGIQVFVTGATGAAAYDSTELLDELSVIPLVRIAPIAAFMKLWLYGETADKALIHASRGGDIF